ncbi:unnamed protein product [Rotaria socialis]|uniref:Uncharacterized protein n=1 Tax=Rotaria socialis TaxID=392032 RepID=A0A817WDB2_9BILA|nr:unnamed protein product [Rotaria socialis]CAF3354052.1 unnamed protein product [Rotaria socialis]CAF3404821.1 unnamed protein product [Rotaria socialis]CAF4255929.1 unnamed protein product [Rotaria socialis]CAF4412816.1 unnamed protein product [Rotaria socialis]
MACQHPNCSYPIHSICVHHCHWSLCEKHIDEHKRSLTVEFEELLQDLIEPADQLSNIVDKTKNSLTLEHQKQLDCLKQTYEKQINEIEQQLTNLSEIQDQRNNISKQLSKIQANEILLTHDDFQKIEFLTKEITQFMKSSKDKEENKVNLQPKRSKFTKCPLTTLNVYGLALSHNVRLCCPKKKNSTFISSSL